MPLEAELESLLNNLVFWVVLLYVGSTLVFMPFVKNVTKQPLLKSLACALLLQAISLCGYGCLYSIACSVAVHLAGTMRIHSVHALFLPIFFASLVTVLPLSSVAAKFLLHLKNADEGKTILAGNAAAASIMWLALWLSPL